MNSKDHKITILHSNNSMTLFYSLYPFINNKRIRNNFIFTNSLNFCLEKDTNKYLLIIRSLTGKDWDSSRRVSVLKELRRKYKNISWFNDEDGTNISHPEVLPFINTYFKKQFLKNKKMYEKKIYTGRLFTDYYYNKFGVSDEGNHYSKPINEYYLSKIKLAWNIGIGCYPRRDLSRKVGVIFSQFISFSLLSHFYTKPKLSFTLNNKEIYDVHARFSVPKNPNVAFQRNLILEKIPNNIRSLTGKTSKRQYEKEMQESKIVLSPFGYGEVCFRDFEAILNGALLLKPDMSHIETWPDVYIPYETYVPIKWDGSDLTEKVNYYLNNEEERRRIARNAFDIYQKSLNNINKKISKVIGSIRE